MRKNNLMRGLALTLALTMTFNMSSFTAAAAEETAEVTEAAEEVQEETVAEAEEETAVSESAEEPVEEVSAEAETSVEASAEAEEDLQAEEAAEVSEETEAETDAEDAEAAVEEETAEETVEEEVLTEEGTEAQLAEAETVTINASAVTVADSEYLYADVSGAGEASVKITYGEKEYALSDFTAIGDTGIVYYSDKPLTGKLYGTSADNVTSFTDFYSSEGVSASGADYDVISSATEFTGRHVKDIPAIIARNDSGIVGIYDNVEIDAAEYAEAAVLNAAAKELTEAQKKLLAVTLNEDPAVNPEAAGKTVKVAAASYNYSCKYGDGEFVINPDDTVDGFVWSDYKDALYAAVISDGSSKAGAIWWTDLYGESATSGPHYNKVEIAVNNGTSKGSNQASVGRYASMYNSAKQELKAGTYTVTLYARGYNTVSTEVQVKSSFDGEVKAALYGDKKSVEISGIDGMENPRATVVRTEGTGRQAVTYTYASDAEIRDGKAALDTTENELIFATYTVTVNSDNYAPVVTTFEYAYSGYVLMNIPYSAFYAAEGAGVVDVDAVSSATNKTGNYGFAGGAYHSGTTYDGSAAVGGANGSKMQGVIWPVKAENYSDVMALGGQEVTDGESVTTATMGHGSTTVQTLVGYEALTEKPSYSFYVLGEEPSDYLVLSGGSFTSANSGEAKAEAEADVIYGSHWGDIQLNVTAADVSDKLVSAVVLTAEDGTKAGMYHLDQIWRGTQFAWKVDQIGNLDGKKITNVRFYCMVKDAELTDASAPAYANYVYDYPVNAEIAKVYTGEVKAVFDSPSQITVAGLPEDAANVKARVYHTTGGRGATLTYITPLAVDPADDDIDPVSVDVVNGKIPIEKGSVTNKAGTTMSFGEPVIGTTYNVELSSDNYVFRPFTAECTKYQQSFTVTKSTGTAALIPGKTAQVKASGAKGALTYTSSDASIATVTAAGKVTAKKPGIVRITVKAAETDEYNAAVRTVSFKVVPAATAKVTPVNTATGIKVTWQKVTGATGYSVYRNNKLVKTVTGLTLTDTAVKNGNGTKYTYKIVALTKGVGASTVSRTASVFRLTASSITSVKNTAAKKATVKYTKNAKATGYQIRFALKKNMSGAKSVTVTKAGTLTRVLSGLTKGKTYYVQIRTYKKVGTTKSFSAWSAVKSVKITK